MSNQNQDYGKSKRVTKIRRKSSLPKPDKASKIIIKKIDITGIIPNNLPWPKNKNVSKDNDETVLGLRLIGSALDMLSDVPLITLNIPNVTISEGILK